MLTNNSTRTATLLVHDNPIIMRFPYLLLFLFVAIACGTKTENQVEYGSHAAVGKYIDVNDIKIYYETYGEGEPLLLLHGNRGSIDNFSLQIPSLAKYFKVIAVDSRGQGRSYDSDKDITYALMASDMAALIDTLHLGKVHVVGWSDGGNTGLELAYAYPDKVLNVVTFGANYTHEDWLAPADSVVMADDDPLRKASTGIIEKHNTAFERLSPDKERIPAIKEKLQILMDKYPNFTTAQLNTIQVPFLIVAGDHDIINLNQTIALFNNIPKAQLFIVPGATHFAPAEHPDLINREVIRFLTSKYRDIDRWYFFK
jgi:pimeloyl-ACP methyl ester carboxylesterase